mmetsp:Transcript_3487/g.5367  ORF Transcript_3487/g.5367 Transcript_3487/m.5367 type:complete len:81 (-) Transcript_3487:1380-1622(-)
MTDLEINQILDKATQEVKQEPTHIEPLIEELKTEVKSMLVMYKIKKNEARYQISRQVQEMLLALPQATKNTKLSDFIINS